MKVYSAGTRERTGGGRGCVVERERYSSTILLLMEESNQIADQLVLGGIRTAVLEAWRPTRYHFASGADKMADLCAGGQARPFVYTMHGYKDRT